MTQEVDTRKTISEAELAGIETFADALALAQDAYGLAAAHEELGTGFEVIDTAGKATLVGVRMLFLQWSFRDGDQGAYVSVEAVTESGRKVVINDGSTGIYAQLKLYTDKTGKHGGLGVKRGLRRSDYQYEGADGIKRDATTFYIDTSA